MAETETTVADGSGLTAGTKVAVLRGTWEGDTNMVIAPAVLVVPSGAEDARTFAIPGGDAANGLDVDVTRLPSDPLGANADAAGTVNGANSISAKLRLMTSQLDAIQTSLAALDNGIAGNEFQVDIVSGGLSITRPATSAVTTTATSQTVATLKASNANRLGLTIHNESESVLYVKLGATATTSDWTFKLDPDASLPPEWFAGYTGIVTGIHATGLTGTAHVTELTA